MSAKNHPNLSQAKQLGTVTNKAMFKRQGFGFSFFKLSWIWLIVLFVAAGSCLFLVNRLSADEGNPRLFLEPSTGTTYQVGQRFSVSMYLDIDVANNPWPAHNIVSAHTVLRFDRAYLQVDRVRLSPVFSRAAPGIGPNYYDNITGEINIWFTEPLPGVPRPEHHQYRDRLLLATIDLTAINQASQARLYFDAANSFLVYDDGSMINEDYDGLAPNEGIVWYVINPAAPPPACQAQAYLRPVSGETFVVGTDVINIDIMLDSSCEIVDVDLALSFDPNYLRLRDYDLTSNILASQPNVSVDNSNGSLVLQATLLEVRDTFNLATLTFTGLAVTPSTPVSFTYLTLADVNAVQILATSVDASYTLVASQVGRLNFLNIQADPHACATGWCAAIEWNTSVPASAPRVRFGTSSGRYTNSVNGRANSSTSFSAYLQNLSADQTYYYQVCNTAGLPAVSQAPQQNSWLAVLKSWWRLVTRPVQAQSQTEQCSAEQTFITSAGGALSMDFGPQVTLLSPTTARVEWGTNRATAVNYVEFKETRGTIWQRVDGPSGGRRHIVDLTGLVADTDYLGRVISEDGGESVRKVFSFRTSGIISYQWDANVILKVERDRVCDKWLYCDSAVEIADNQGNKENMCFHVGVCDEFDVEGKYCSRPIFQVDQNQTFEINTDNPDLTNIDLAKNLSGHAKVGANWTIDGNVYSLEGYYPYSTMQEKGNFSRVPNGDFENDDESYYPWQPRHPAGYWGDECQEELAIVQEDNNNYLLITPWSVDKFSDGSRPCGTGSGASIYLGSHILATGSDYFVSFDLKINGQPSEDDDVITVIFSRHEPNREGLGNMLVDDWPLGWRKVVVGPITPRSAIGDLSRASLDITYYNRGTQVSTEPVPSFAIDNVEIKPVLPYQDAGEGRELAVAPTCRMYPDEGAPACDYTDKDTGEIHYGWKGYCVEKDPKNEKLCLQWWPVDIISGTADVFNREDIAGYGLEAEDRYPLYYCLEAKGNYQPRRVLCEHYCHQYDNNRAACAADPWCTDQWWGSSSICWPASGFESDCYSKSSIAECEQDPYCRITVKSWGDKYKIPVSIATADRSLSSCDKHCSVGEFTFRVCRDRYEPNDLVLSLDRWAPEYHLLEDEIAGVVLEKVCDVQGAEYPASIVISRDKFDTSEELAGASYHYSREVEPVSGNIWWRVEGTCVPGESNCIKFALQFNSRHQLVEMTYNGDDSTGNNQEEGGYQVYFYLREPCMTLAKVVTEYGENKARVFRLRQKSNPLNNALGYSYLQDYQPFGGAVVSTPVSNPSQWTRWLPLYVEPSNSLILEGLAQAGISLAGSARAGSPYGLARSDQGFILGKLGPATCISGSKVGAACQTHQDCGYGFNQQPGYCVGLTFPQTRDSELGGDANNEYWQNVDNQLTTIDPALRLKELFVKSYGIWQWDETEGHYVLCGEGGGMRDDCVLGFGTTDIYRLDDNGQWNFDFTMEGERPQVPNETQARDAAKDEEHYIAAIRVNSKINQNVYINYAGPAILKFYSMVNEDQKPLVRYSVDWGDGKITTENGLRTGGRPNLDNPHVLMHYYYYHDPDEDFPGGGTYADHGCDDQGCIFRPCIQIEDNWGMCNVREGANPSEPCGEGEVFWTCYPQYISISSGSNIYNPLAELRVSPNQFDINIERGTTDSQTRTTVVSNYSQGQAILDWDTDRSNFNQPPFNLFVRPPSGSLAAGASQNMQIDISGLRSLGVGSYTKNFSVIDTSGISGSRLITINVNVTTGSLPPLEPGDFPVTFVVSNSQPRTNEPITFTASVTMQPGWQATDDLRYEFDFDRDGRVDRSLVRPVGAVVRTDYTYFSRGSYMAVVTVTHPRINQVARAWLTIEVGNLNP